MAEPQQLSLSSVATATKQTSTPLMPAAETIEEDDDGMVIVATTKRNAKAISQIEKTQTATTTTAVSAICLPVQQQQQKEEDDSVTKQVLQTDSNNDKMNNNNNNNVHTAGAAVPDTTEVVVTAVPVPTSESVNRRNNSKAHNAVPQQQQQQQLSNNKRRQCRFPGCDRVIKSQGHCQRHGARAKRCRYANCDKQAQGTHDGLCKRHWRIVSNQNQQQQQQQSDKENTAKGERISSSKDESKLSSSSIQQQEPTASPETAEVLVPVGVSVYEYIIPNSITYRPSLHPMTMNTATTTTTTMKKQQHSTVSTTQQLSEGTFHDGSNTMSTNEAVCTSEEAAGMIGDCIAVDTINTDNKTTLKSPSAANNASIRIQPNIPPRYNNCNTDHNQVIMPLEQYINDNVHLPFGWHRIHERQIRYHSVQQQQQQQFPVTSLTTQFESWERQLAFIEICLLSGGTVQQPSTWKNFCHAWGRERTFITHLTTTVCEKRGNMDRTRSNKSSTNNNNNNGSKRYTKRDKSIGSIDPHPMKKTKPIGRQTTISTPPTNNNSSMITEKPTPITGGIVAALSSPDRSTIIERNAATPNSVTVPRHPEYPQQKHHLNDANMMNIDDSPLPYFVHDEFNDKDTHPSETAHV